jgi:hypothetical protein
MRCKFKLQSINRSMGSVAKRTPDGALYLDENGRQVWCEGEVWSVKMAPVYANGDPDHENTKFWAASPSGLFEVNTVNKAAVDSLVLGDEYYIDITKA